MFDKILNWLFPGRVEEDVPVIIHDFTERCVGHDIALHYNPADDTGSALISSLERIQVGEFIDTPEVGSLFIVTEVKEEAPMLYRVELNLVDQE